jgi:hypothetical protein
MLLSWATTPTVIASKQSHLVCFFIRLFIQGKNFFSREILWLGGIRRDVYFFDDSRQYLT